MSDLEKIQAALEDLWMAHSVVKSGGSWERHVEPEIYKIYKDVMPIVERLIRVDQG